MTIGAWPFLLRRNRSRRDHRSRSSSLAASRRCFIKGHDRALFATHVLVTRQFWQGYSDRANLDLSCHTRSGESRIAQMLRQPATCHASTLMAEQRSAPPACAVRTSPSPSRSTRSTRSAVSGDFRRCHHRLQRAHRKESHSAQQWWTTTTWRVHSGGHTRARPTDCVSLRHSAREYSPRTPRLLSPHSPIHHQ